MSVSMGKFLLGVDGGRQPGEGAANRTPPSRFTTKNLYPEGGEEGRVPAVFSVEMKQAAREERV